MGATTGHEHPTSQAGRAWWALVAMLLAAAMDLIDTTTINVAVPSIRADLGASAAEIEWSVAGYALAFGVGLITGSRLGDRFGRRRAFLLGVGGFLLASLTSGLAPNAEILVASRVGQGAMAAVMIPQILTVIQVSFAPGTRAKAYAAYGATAAIATVSGPLLGGLLVQADLFGLGWRAIFLINLPIGLVALIVTAATLPESRAEHAERFDLPGVGLLAAALLLVLYPLIQGPQQGWPGWTLLVIAAAVPMSAAFLAQQRRRQATGRSPLVAPSLFSQRGFTGGVATQLTLYAGVTGFFLVLAITLQTGLGFSALHTGLTFLPWSLGIALAAGAAGQLAPRLGRRLTTTGMLIMATGMAGLLVALNITGPTPNTWALAPGLVIAGIGMGLVAPTLVDVALANVDTPHAGSASGVVTTAGQLGGALGVAAIGVVFFGALPAGATTATDYTAALTATLYYEIGVFLLTAALMLLLPKPDRASSTHVPTGAAR